MARLELVIKQITRDGVDIGSGQAVIGADDAMFVNNGRTALKCDNTTGAPIIVTLVTPVTFGQDALAIADKTYSVPASVERWIGPWPVGEYNQPSGADAGKVYVDLPSDGVTVTAVSI